MSTATATPRTSTRPLDISSTPKISFARLVRVELRKTADTRAGFWLLIAIVAVTALILTIFFFAAPDDERTFSTFFGITSTPQGLLLPVLGILLVTSEWGQRTALTTFTLVPHRSTVIWAKVAAAILVGIAAVAAALVLATIFTALAGTDGTWDDFTVDFISRILLIQISVVVLGLAFGLLFLNSAAAIVTFFILPIAITTISVFWSALAKIAPWVDLNTAQEPLLSSAGPTGEQWWQLLVASTIWIIVPFIVGLIRVMRAEVK